MPKLIGEYFDVKIGDSDIIRIPKVAFHKERLMTDHEICQKLASQFNPNQEEINIASENVPNEKLFENLLVFSFTNSSELTFSRNEYKDLEKICFYFKLHQFIQFVKEELRRIDFSCCNLFSMVTMEWSIVYGP